MINQNNIDTFYCYDQGMSRYLVSKGFRYLTRARHYKTGNEFTLFIRTDEMQKYIDKWNQSREFLK